MNALYTILEPDNLQGVDSLIMGIFLEHAAAVAHATKQSKIQQLLSIREFWLLSAPRHFGMQKSSESSDECR